MNVRNKNLIKLLLVSILMLTIISLNGCKKKSEPAKPAETKEVTSAKIEQKTCPVMGNPINKNLYTEYKGKKVYFCCPGCKPKFEADPEKYVTKLPQFSK
ncbi:MAG: YHS domain-containing protein [Planctomycetota bacterium]